MGATLQAQSLGKEPGPYLAHPGALGQAWATEGALRVTPATLNYQTGVIYWHSQHSSQSGPCGLESWALHQTSGSAQELWSKSKPVTGVNVAREEGW